MEYESELGGYTTVTGHYDNTGTFIICTGPF